MTLFFRGHVLKKWDYQHPVSPRGRSDCNDNTAEAHVELEVLEGPEVEIGWYETSDRDGSSMDGTDEASNLGVLPPETLGINPLLEGGNTSDIYEVDRILDGPKRRREHLNKICYKVRWKGYGPEEDTWQPLSDLLYVQDMIEEYKKEKNEQAKQKKRSALKEKKTPECSNSRNNDMEAKRAKLSAEEGEEDGSESSWHPDYGYMKDTFWKDLELGRHNNNVEFFGGDMYSKVKGSRRAAHAEALANIQKHQQQLQNKTSPPVPPRTKHISPKPAAKHRGQRTLPNSLSSPSLSSRSATALAKKRTKPAPRGRKRPCEPFSARGYMSAKRSRRSREFKSATSSPEKRSSVTSETVEMVTTSDLSDISYKETADKQGTEEEQTLSQDDTEKDEVFEEEKETPLMTVSSETVLTVTTEGMRFEDDVIKPEPIFSLSGDNMYQVPYLNRENDGASGSEILSLLCSDASAAANSSKPLPNSAREIFEEDKSQTSASDVRAEASGSVEPTHSEVCLWDGACNRADCKASRRWNMKNGKAQNSGGGTSKRAVDTSTSSSGVSESTSTGESSSTGESTSSRSTTSSSSSTARETVSSSSMRDGVFSSSDLTPPSQRRLATPFNSSPLATSKSPVKVSNATKNTSEPVSPDVVQSAQALFSSRLLSSDSSFDDSVGAPLTREAVVDSFGRMNALAQRMHMDTIAGSSVNRGTSSAGNSISSFPERNSSVQTSVSNSNRRPGDGSERPGLFSDNAFRFFAREQPSVRGPTSTSTSSSSITATTAIPHTPALGFVLPSPTGSINLSSPGKENSHQQEAKPAALSTGSSHDRLHAPMDGPSLGIIASLSQASSQIAPGQSRSSMPDGQDGWQSRKRSGDTSQPLEKIPSPNSRQRSDLDRRINALTCDELEDFSEQGDERHERKDPGFVSNADLLQAVILGKAEVVKRAMRQLSSGHQLDLEQADSSDLTLLMKAVQKGNIAIVEMLLENGANANAQQKNGTTALMMAAEQNSVCLVALLLKHGANSSLYTMGYDQAETALLKAIKRQHREVVNLMLRVGVNIAAPSCNSMSALQLAVERRNSQIESLVKTHVDRLTVAFENRVLSTLEDTAVLVEQMFPLQCFPLREAQEFVVKFMSNVQAVTSGEGFLLFIAHTKINERGVRCRFHGNCPISSVTLNGVEQNPLTRGVNFVTSFHPILPGCNTLTIKKLPDYTSKAKLLVSAYRAKLNG